jgi:hypothetical protein
MESSEGRIVCLIQVPQGEDYASAPGRFVKSKQVSVGEMLHVKHRTLEQTNALNIEPGEYFSNEFDAWVD